MSTSRLIRGALALALCAIASVAQGFSYHPVCATNAPLLRIQRCSINGEDISGSGTCSIPALDANSVITIESAFKFTNDDAPTSRTFDITYKLGGVTLSTISWSTTTATVNAADNTVIANQNSLLAQNSQTMLLTTTGTPRSRITTLASGADTTNGGSLDTTCGIRAPGNGTCTLFGQTVVITPCPR